MSVAAELIYGEVPMEIEDSMTVTDGAGGEVDELKVDYLCTWPTYTDELAYAGIIKNDPFPDVDEFWVKGFSVKKEGSARCVVTVNSLGMIGGFVERRLRSISAFGQVVSIGPIEKIILVVTDGEAGTDPETDTAADVRRRVPKLDSEGEPVYKTIVTPSGSAERWNINEAGIRVSDVYFSTTEPDMTVVKTAITPTDAPAVPADPWTGYQEPMRGNHPYGWILDDRGSEELIEGKLWRLSDTFGYYLEAVPD